MADFTSPQYCLEQIKAATNLTQDNASSATENIVFLLEYCPIDTLTNLASFLLSDNEEIATNAIAHASCIYMCQIIGDPRKSKAQEFWKQLSDQTKAQLISAAQRSLLFTNSVGLQGACLLAKIFNYEPVQTNLAEYIKYILTDKNFTEEHKKSVYALILELSYPSNVTRTDEKSALIERILLDTEEFFMQNFAEMLNYDQSYQVAFLQMFNAYIAMIRPENIAGVYKPIYDIAEAQLFPNIQDDVVFLELYRLLYSMLINIYEEDNFDELLEKERFIMCGVNGLSCNPPLLTQVLTFWLYVFKFERDILKQNREILKFRNFYSELIKNKEPNFLKLPEPRRFHNITDAAANEIIDILFNLIVPDPNATDPEDRNDPDIHMWCCEILSVLADTYPPCLEKVKDFCIQNLDDEKWEVQHAVAVLPFVYCQDDVVDKSSAYRAFILSMIPKLIEHLQSEETPIRLVETAIYTLTCITKYFAIFSYGQTTNMESLMQGFMIQYNRHPQIAIRIMGFVNETMKFPPKIDENSKFDNFIIALHEAIKEAYPQLQGVIRVNYKMLYLYMVKISKWDNDYEKLKSMIETIFSNLQQLSIAAFDGSMEMSLRHTNTQCNLWLLTSLFRRYKDQLREISSPAAAKLFEMLKSSEDMQEEILECLFTIINALPQEDNETQDRIIEYIPIAIGSNSPRLAVMSLTALSYLLKNLGERGSLIFDASLNEIFSLLDNVSFPVFFKSELLAALARVLDVYKEKISIPDMEQLFSKLYSYISIDWGEYLENQELLMNEMYDSIYKCYTALISTDHVRELYMDKPSLRKFFKRLVMPLRAYAGQVNDMSLETIESIAQFLDKMRQMFNRQANIYLNYFSNYFIIIWGMVQTQNLQTSKYESLKNILRLLIQS
ncbi:hypothetical protein TVAG_402040 [Trichomonas vaginalis G3]|uniref:Uncharacterized protein n=1 Tax=Trichomonas vaginalis (strain ATCC PRA-98 / G3) TaxID=412133 RepID=A2DHW1_TRIV3|nr:armadillo (ARM) repeat-containing protein family [Trichomonas vaginalis G3]EAY19950.1 hypothetical protein TVAG_402040 [Trichomonas vaginalis G3]KAI5525900.1 armadillo (ARM) repeat-containing protein family [Trichomonas vaginalis G3]|eukprot:XP_001580936.1 hypothetical protein [Trichomonas vaginalis G3]